MKYISFLVLLVLITSCGQKQADKIKDTDHSIKTVVNQDNLLTTQTGETEAPINPQEIGSDQINTSPDSEVSSENTTKTEVTVSEDIKKNEDVLVETVDVSTVSEVVEDQFVEKINEVSPEDANKGIKLESDPVEDNAVIIEEDEKVNEIIEKSAGNLDIEIAEISETAGSKLIEVKGDYTNPDGPVDMIIAYKLDKDGKIIEINTSATTYDLSKFQEKVTDVIGKTVEEASETYFSGSSLTTEAFQKAMKKQIK